MSTEPTEPTRLTKKQRAEARAERAAAMMMEQRRKERRRRTLSVLGVVVAVAAIIVGLVLIGRMGGEDDETPAAAPTDYGFVLGPDDAPHQVVVYEDFLCPVCGAFEGAVGGQLDELAASGDVQIEYRPIAFLERFGPYSADAANAFFVVEDQGDDEVTDAFHDLLFADQPSEEGPTFPGPEELLASAVQAGADEDAVSDGILNGSSGDDVDAATAEAVDANVTGTPTVILDGEPVGGATIGEVADNLIADIEPTDDGSAAPSDAATS